MGIENAKHLGEMLLGMADQNLYTGGDYDTVILNLRKNQIDLASEIAEMQEKKKGFVSFRLDNRGEIAENFRELLVAYKPIGPYGWNIPDCP